MPTFKLRHAITAGIAACAIPLQAAAQQAEAPQPPRLERLEEGEAPAITIRKPDAQSRTTEKRTDGGKVTEIKVTTGNSTYYLKPNDQPGSAVVGDAQSNSIRGAQWEVLVFDLGGSKEEKEPGTAQTMIAEPLPPPSPPATPASKK